MLLGVEHFHDLVALDVRGGYGPFLVGGEINHMCLAAVDFNNTRFRFKYDISHVFDDPGDTRKLMRPPPSIFDGADGPRLQAQLSSTRRNELPMVWP